MKKLISMLCILGILSSCAPVVVGGAAATGATLASQERTVGTTIDDTTIATSVRHNLMQASPGLFADIGVEVNRGRVLLTGLANSIDEISQASKLAWQANGVKEVINEIQIIDKSQHNIVEDSWITSKIRSKMLFAKGVHSMDVAVETVQGIVYLFGTARSRDELGKMVAIARRVNGVKKVVSHVNVKS